MDPAIPSDNNALAQDDTSDNEGPGNDQPPLDTATLTACTSAGQTTADPTPSAFYTGENPRKFWNDREGFRPSDLMNQQAVKGKFSLRTILSTNDELVQHPSAERDVGFDESTDPISLGLINFPVAVSLFEE